MSSVMKIIVGASLVLASPLARAGDSGWDTIYWVSIQEDGDVNFILNGSLSVYYKCPGGALFAPDPCVNILFSTIPFATMEVRAFYSSGSGTSSSPYVLDTLRVH